MELQNETPTIVDNLVRKYKLEKHPEGGYFYQTYKSNAKIKLQENERSAGTAIYYLLANQDFSAFHRLKSDEIWHYYSGSSLSIYVLDPTTNNLKTHKLGNPTEDKTSPQVTIPAGSWFAAEVDNKESYTFVGCTVSPGFEYQDFELANRRALSFKFNQYKDLIERFTREPKKEEEFQYYEKEEATSTFSPTK